MTFEQFVKNSGFSSYPFSSFTAETEKDKQANLFVSFSLYSPIIEAFRSGQSIILSGDRGTGKTSITYDFVRSAAQDTLLCQIDDYSSLPEEYDDHALYRFVISSIVNRIFNHLPEARFRVGSLTEDDRILLTYFFVNFASDATRGNASRVSRDIQTTRFKKCITALYNFLRSPLNVATNAAVSIVGDIVARAAGVSNIDVQVREYFPEVVAGVQTEFPNPDATLEALRKLVALAKRLGYKKITLILDKIDEDQRFKNAAEDIAKFVQPILSNNKLMLDCGCQVVVSLWIVPLNFLAGEYRAQKIYSPEVTWDNDDLMKAYDKRVSVFADGEGRNFADAFDAEVDPATKRSILELSNGNPRDLWHLMDKIFRAQFEINPTNSKISRSAVEMGKSNFVESFDFYEYYPRKSNARANSMDVYSYIRHLLTLESSSFTRNQLNDRAGTGSSTGNYTVGMENLGLIRRDYSDKGEVRYFIRDPKVRYALENGIPITKE